MNPSQRQPVWERLPAETSWPRKGILVAEVDGSVAGFAGLGPTREGTRTATIAEIAAIYLAPEVWGAGIGSRLMTTVLETFAQAGYEQATLWVLANSTVSYSPASRAGLLTSGQRS